MSEPFGGRRRRALRASRMVEAAGVELEYAVFWNLLMACDF
jgi:hypothetical protein